MRILIAALAALVVTPALAQSSADAPGTRHAAQLIATADGADIFEPLPSEGPARVLHRASGLVCEFELGKSNTLHVFPTFARGEDIGCDSGGGGEVRTLYATRYPSETSIEDQLNGAVTAMRARMRGLEPLPPEPVIEPDPEAATLPAQLSARFVFPGPNGMNRYTRVSVAMIDGWVIKLRYTADAPDDASLAEQDLRANAIWRAALTQLVDAHSI